MFYSVVLFVLIASVRDDSFAILVRPKAIEIYENVDYSISMAAETRKQKPFSSIPFKIKVFLVTYW